MSKPATKFVKAYCDKTKRYFGLEVRQDGDQWKVVNFTQLTSEQAKVASSEVDQSSFDSNDNLLPCDSCGSRHVGGCGCAERKGGCTPTMKYRFQCLYCHQLKIDHSLPKKSALFLQYGSTISLAQGQEVKIRFADERVITKLRVGIGWDPADDDDYRVDVDASVVVIGSNGDRELVYFGDLAHPSGCVVHHGDNLTGEDKGASDDEIIDVDLKKVPANRNQLFFILNIYKCDERNETLSGIKNLYIKIVSPDPGIPPLIQYKVDNMQLRGNDTAIVIGFASRQDEGWAFKAVGKTLRVSDVDTLRDCCDRYR